MKRGCGMALVIAAAVTACAAPGRAGTSATAAETPQGMLTRAIERAGGSAALERARALIWEGEATVHAGGRTIELSGRWAVQPPDSAVVSTYEASRGPSSTRRLILSGTRGWLERDGQLTPMPATVLANERDQFYLYSVMRLVPLRAPEVQLTWIDPDSLGQRGVRVTQPGRPDVEMYVDEMGRLARLRASVTDATTGRAVVQDVWLAGTVEAGGVRWPRSVRIMVEGRPYFEMEIRTLTAAVRLNERALAGPR